MWTTHRFDNDNKQQQGEKKLFDRKFHIGGQW